MSLFQGCLTASSCLQTKCVHQQSQNPPPHGWRCFWSGSALKALIQSSPPDRVQPGKWDYWCWLTVSTNLHTAVSGHTDSDSNQMKFHTHIPKLSLSIKTAMSGAATTWSIYSITVLCQYSVLRICWISLANLMQGCICRAGCVNFGSSCGLFRASPCQACARFWD